MGQLLKVDGRKLPRYRCRMDSRVKYLNQEATARVVDVSDEGLSVELYGHIHAAEGSQITVMTSDIGLIEGTVRWRRASRIGVLIKQNSNSLAQLSAYFRNFHQEVRPTLVR
ncbi:PilZ domain-containing protein [Agrobacterium sp. ES01]|uniref:PilZ domain-containing protein n=1 Tax=Agrobacterium sp. ES01 TaxID=3420714 RepID=UPI003D0E2760